MERLIIQPQDERHHRQLRYAPLGTGGLAFFISDEKTRKGMKFWMSEEDRKRLKEVL